MIVFDENQIMELDREYHNIKKVDSYYKRVQALYYRSKGLLLDTVSDITGFAKASIAHWSTAYRQGGLSNTVSLCY